METLTAQMKNSFLLAYSFGLIMSSDRTKAITTDGTNIDTCYQRKFENLPSQIYKF